MMYMYVIYKGHYKGAPTALMDNDHHSFGNHSNISNTLNDVICFKDLQSSLASLQHGD